MAATQRLCEQMFVKDGEGRGWLSQVVREGAGFYPVARKGVCGHTPRCWPTQVVEEGVGLYQVIRKALACRCRRQRRVLAVTGGHQWCSWVTRKAGGFMCGWRGKVSVY